MSEVRSIEGQVLPESAEESASAPLCDETGRQEERYPATGEAEVFVKSDGSIIRGRVLNISALGCYVQTVAPISLAPGTRVQMMIDIKGSNLEIVAEARFSKPGMGKGFRFLDMTKDTRKRLAHVLDRVMPKVEVEVAPRRVWHDAPKR